MPRLTDGEKTKVIDLIEKGKPLPPLYKEKLFASEEGTFIQATKEYRLVYDGKTRREEVIANTPEAPFQLVREFNSDNAFRDGWRNMLIYGDNLLALKELYADQRGPNRYRTRDRIKLIYIDPPFATRQDFMKDKEKAYRDKVIGAQFIEFLRKRLILLREVLAPDGSLFVHLDWKKGHYIKAVLDEVFGETSFAGEIVWQRATAHAQRQSFAIIHDVIFHYRKSPEAFVWNSQFKRHSTEHIDRYYSNVDEDGRRYTLDNLTAEGGGPPRTFWGREIPPPPGTHWRYSQENIDRLCKEGLIVMTAKNRPRFKRYLDTLPGRVIGSLWDDLPAVNSQANEDTRYPTQKPEVLLQRIIKSSSNEGDIILDAFCGSGTAPAVAEKLGRRWIAMECGKLAVYTTQKRLMLLTTTIGAGQKDKSPEYERVEDFAAHLAGSPIVFLVTEKARKGECDITLELLEEMAELIKKYDLAKKDAPFSLVCPESKLKVLESRLQEVEEDGEAGQKRIKLKGVEFRVSFVEPRQKPEKEKPLKAKSFVLYNAGIYDNQAIKQMPWGEYRPFVLKLFQVREHQHFIKGFHCDGYVGVHSAYVWNYPDHKKLTIDYDYVKSLHETLGGSAGEKFYIIAPIVSMGFAEDEHAVGKTTYVFLKVPISILMRLLRSGEHGALKQPTKEADVNEVIDAAGFDFVSQPVVEVKCKKERAPDRPLLKQYVIHLKEFRSKTLATDPEDFVNFETFSMAMVDADYDGETFKLSQVFWADTLIAEEHKRLKEGKKAKGERVSGDVSECEQLSLRIFEEDFTGKQMMVIFCDRYGNEKKLVFKKEDFR